MKSDVILKIEKEIFETIPAETRRMFQILKVEPQDFDQHRNDKNFISLNADYKRASKKLTDYLFEKRNGS